MKSRRICLIGKYPPIEGGVSVQAYWLTRALAERGHEVHVVTNSGLVEPAYRMANPGEREPHEPTDGSVTVHDILPFQDRSRWYIPQGRPDVTRLAGVAASVVRDHRCDIVLSWYLEPYAVAGALVSAWLRIPHLVRHAGSDLFDLGTDPELGAAYREILRTSDGVVSAASPVDGIDPSGQAAIGAPPTLLPDVWRENQEDIDLDSLGEALAAKGLPVLAPKTGRNPGRPVVGMYGKLGGRKGARQLVAAAAAVSQAGTPLHVAMVGVPGPMMAELRDQAAGLGFTDSLYALPPLIPEMMPRFVRTCSAVAYLEHDFGVTQHRSSPPAEILASGVPLVLAADSRHMLPRDLDTAGVTASVVITDPTDETDLGRALLESLHAPAPPRDAAYAWFGTQAEVAEWYEAQISRAIGDHGDERPLPGDTASATLRRWCPTAATSLAAPIDSAALTGPTYGSAQYEAYELLRAAMAAAHWQELTAEQQDLVRAEFAFLRAGLDGSLIGEGSPYRTPVIDEQAWEATGRQLTPDVRPVTSRWCAVERFRFDALAHLSQLGTTKNAGATIAVRRLEKEQLLAFYRRSNLTRGCAAISITASEILRLADGDRTLRDIHAAAAPERSEDDVIAVVRKLGRAGLLAYRRLP